MQYLIQKDLLSCVYVICKINISFDNGILDVDVISVSFALCVTSFGCSVAMNMTQYPIGYESDTISHDIYRSL